MWLSVTGMTRHALVKSPTVCRPSIAGGFSLSWCEGVATRPGQGKNRAQARCVFGLRRIDVVSMIVAPRHSGSAQEPSAARRGHSFDFSMRRMATQCRHRCHAARDSTTVVTGSLRSAVSLDIRIVSWLTAWRKLAHQDRQGACIAPCSRASAGAQRSRPVARPPCIRSDNACPVRRCGCSASCPAGTGSRHRNSCDRARR